MKTISSRQNPVVHAFRELAAEPDPTGTRLLLDGIHLVREAHDEGLEFELVAVAQSKLSSDTEEAHLIAVLKAESVEVVDVSDQVMAAMSPVRTSSGLIGIARRLPTTPAGLCAASNGFLLGAIDVQDPGNVGALLRAAEAGGVTGAFVCGTSANPFSWKALRGSMGSGLRLPIVAGMGTDEVLACMKQSGARIVGAVARGGDDPDVIDWTGRVGLLLGGEGSGLPEEIVAHCDVCVTIPMAPTVESLNVAAAGAILVYAARRQRQPTER